MTDPVTTVPTPTATPTTQTPALVNASVAQATQTTPRPDPATMPLPAVPSVEVRPPGGETAAASPAATEPPAPAPPEPTPEEKTKIQRAREAADKVRARAAARRKAELDRIGTSARAAQLEAQLQTERLAREHAEARADLARRAIEERTRGETSTPEGRLARLEAELAESRRFIAERDARDRQRSQATAIDGAKQVFLTEASASTEFPLVAAHAKIRGQTLIAEAQHVIQEVIARTGRPPSNKDVLAYLEWQYSEVDKARSPATGTNGTQAAAATPPKEQAAAAPSAAGVRTLNGRTVERTTVAPTFNELSPDEQLVVMARQLKAAQQK